MADRKRIDEPTGTETVGHEWDGIEELNTPLPRWWLWLFYVTIAWGVAYTIAYPAWPMISKATAGVLNWTSRGQLERELAADREKRAPIMNAIDTITNMSPNRVAGCCSTPSTTKGAPAMKP